MQIRRRAAAWVVAVALAGGGALTACSSPTAANTGTPKDTASNSTANNSPGSTSDDNLPNDSNRVPSSGAGRAGGNGKGVP